MHPEEFYLFHTYLGLLFSHFSAFQVANLISTDHKSSQSLRTWITSIVQSFKKRSVSNYLALNVKCFMKIERKTNLGHSMQNDNNLLITLETVRSFSDVQGDMRDVTKLSSTLEKCRLSTSYCQWYVKYFNVRNSTVSVDVSRQGMSRRHQRTSTNTHLVSDQSLAEWRVFQFQVQEFKFKSFIVRPHRPTQGQTGHWHS